MSDRDAPSQDDDAERLHDLERRLHERSAQRRTRQARRTHAQMGALGVAWRMSIELVAALLVGGAVGLGLDRLLGWTPWLMLVGLALGFAAGVRGAVRTAYTMQTPQAPGESPEGLTPAPDDDDED